LISFIYIFWHFSNGLTASAICAFTLTDLNRAFNGPFKGQETTKSNWLPIPDDEVPTPRPGDVSVMMMMMMVMVMVIMIDFDDDDDGGGVGDGDGDDD
jgi:hypothetical protein